MSQCSFPLVLCFKCASSAAGCFLLKASRLEHPDKWPLSVLSKPWAGATSSSLLLRLFWGVCKPLWCLFFCFVLDTCWIALCLCHWQREWKKCWKWCWLGCLITEVGIAWCLEPHRWNKLSINGIVGNKIWMVFDGNRQTNEFSYKKPSQTLFWQAKNKCLGKHYFQDTLNC